MELISPGPDADTLILVTSLSQVMTPTGHNYAINRTCVTTRMTEKIAFPQAVPNFRVEVVEMLAAEDTVVIQTVMSGPIPADAPGIAKKGQVVFIPHAYFLRFNTQGKISRLDAYWDNTVLNSIKPSAV